MFARPYGKVVHYRQRRGVLFLEKRAGKRGGVMGGPGSGSWYRWNRKATVEESLVLSMANLRGRIYPHSSGTLTWTHGGTVVATIGYHVVWDSVPTLTLHYRRCETDIRIPIRFDATYPEFGGVRWWFVCPLMVGGVRCNRRAGKLYLPPGAEYFGCRLCHNLTYESAQDAHKAERLFASLGFDKYVAELVASHWQTESVN